MAVTTGAPASEVAAAATLLAAAPALVPSADIILVAAADSDDIAEEAEERALLKLDCMALPVGSVATAVLTMEAIEDASEAMEEYSGAYSLVTELTMDETSDIREVTSLAIIDPRSVELS